MSEEVYRRALYKPPIVTKDDFPNDIVAVFNSGVVKRAANDYIMVFRCEDSLFGRYMWVAESVDGVNFTPRPKPLAMPTYNALFNEYADATKSYWDPRITKIEGVDYYTIIIYDAQGIEIDRCGGFQTSDYGAAVNPLGDFIIAVPSNPQTAPLKPLYRLSSSTLSHTYHKTLPIVR